MATNLQFITSIESGSAVTTFSVDNIFSAKYDVYMFNLNLKGGGSVLQNVMGRLIDTGGSVISTSTYDYANFDLPAGSAFSENKGTNLTAWQNMLIMQSDKGNSSNLYIFNPFDSSSYTFAKDQSTNAKPAFQGRKNIYVEKTAQSYRGIQFVANSGNFSNLAVSVYGVK